MCRLVVTEEFAKYVIFVTDGPIRHAKRSQPVWRNGFVPMDMLMPRPFFPLKS
jgi:hypothetical protein